MKKIILGTIVMAMSFVFNSCFSADSPEVMVTEITILPADPLTVNVDEITLLSVIISPTYATERRVIWESLDPALATVDAITGVVTGVAPGSATIRATAIDGSGVTATKVINVTAPVVYVTSITITPDDPVIVSVGFTIALGVIVLPADATNKDVTWSSLNPEIAAVSPLTGVVSGVSPGTAVIRATANDPHGVSAIKVVTVIPGIEYGVNINGVVWSTRNVDAVGLFAAFPESSGMFYQWNRKVAWPATGSVVGWNTTLDPVVSDWASTTDPSPDGWRVPTKAEIEKLLDNTKVENQLAIVNGVTGRLFVDKTTTNSLFLPATGFRRYEDGVLDETWGIYYWSSEANGHNGYYLRGVGVVSLTLFEASTRMGFPIRPVKK